MFNTPRLHGQLITQVNDSDGRFYRVENQSQKFYSVTTMLGSTADISFLKAWKERIGEKEAQRITTRSSNRGTRLHSCIESLLLNEDLGDLDLITRIKVSELSKFLITDIKELLAAEMRLYSNQLLLAGTTDFVYTDHESRVVVGDLKTAKSKKPVGWIRDYFLQVTAYAICLEEVYNLNVERGLILFSYDNTECDPIFFNPNDYVEELIERNQNFQSLMWGSK